MKNIEIATKPMAIIPALEELKRLNNPQNIKDKIFYLSYLKEIGRLGKKVYALQPEPWLKDWLVRLYKYLKNYDL